MTLIYIDLAPNIICSLFLGEAARVAFFNLRTRYARNLKRKRSFKLKGTRDPETNPDETADEEELYPFLSWLETHIKSRSSYGTSSRTTINVNAYGQEDSGEEEPIVSHEEPKHTDVKSFNNNNLRPKKKAR